MIGTAVLRRSLERFIPPAGTTDFTGAFAAGFVR